MTEPANIQQRVFVCERCGFVTASGMSFDYHRQGCTLWSPLEIYQCPQPWFYGRDPDEDQQP